MVRRTLLDLLGTEKLPQEAEQKFVEFCIWQQARPALVEVLRVAGLAEAAQEAERAATVEALAAWAGHAAKLAQQANLPIMALGAVQGVAAEINQLALSANPPVPDAGAVSFHAARLVGWAGWARNNFRTSTFKASAENIAYGEQLHTLMKMIGAV
mgnify:CR=1 FL=1